MEHPDAKKHQIISFVKSGIRIAGCGASFGAATVGAVVPAIVIISAAMLIAEIVGVYEELV